MGAASAFNDKLIMGAAEAIVIEPWKLVKPSKGPRFWEP
jgi:hypothetical protein